MAIHLTFNLKIAILLCTKLYLLLFNVIIFFLFKNAIVRKQFESTKWTHWITKAQFALGNEMTKFFKWGVAKSKIFFPNVTMPYNRCVLANVSNVATRTPDGSSLRCSRTWTKMESMWVTPSQEYPCTTSLCGFGLFLLILNTAFDVLLLFYLLLISVIVYFNVFIAFYIPILYSSIIFL